MWAQRGHDEQPRACGEDGAIEVVTSAKPAGAFGCVAFPALSPWHAEQSWVPVYALSVARCAELSLKQSVGCLSAHLGAL